MRTSDSSRDTSGRAPARAQAVDQRVLDALTHERPVRQRRPGAGVDRDGEGEARVQVVFPAHGGSALVQLVGAGGGEFGQRHQHAQGGAQLEAQAARGRQVAGHVHAAPPAPRGQAEGGDLGSEQVLGAGGGRDVQPRRLGHWANAASFQPALPFASVA